LSKLRDLSLVTVAMSESIFPDWSASQSILHRGRTGISTGLWYERQFEFGGASMLKAGENTLTLALPAGPINNGVVCDYLRLELDERASAP